MREDLLGYLIGALEPDEAARIEQALQHDPELRAELRRVEERLRPLESGDDEVPLPPPDLVSRTMRALDAITGRPPRENEDEEAATFRGDAGHFSDSFSADDPAPADSFSADDRVAADADQVSTWGSGEAPRSSTRSRHLRRRRLAGSGLRQLPRAAAIERSRPERMRRVDVLASALAIVALAGVVLPALLNGRFEGRRIACQENLRQLGVAVSSFALRKPNGRMPQLARSGPEAFAGIYPLRLNDAGVLDDGMSVWCPAHGTDPERIIEIPSAAALHTMPPPVLAGIQRFSGGSYAYLLGSFDGGRYAAPRWEGRAYFPILSDAPALSLDGVGLFDWERSGHGGRGLNVLYEDGRVEFLSLQGTHALEFHDNPFLNHRGRMEAGVDKDDAVLAPSGRGPFLGVKQW